MQIQGEEFFKDRRERFMQAMDGGIAVFPGMVRQDDGLRNENQAKYFYYLTGCEMNGAWLVFDPEDHHSGYHLLGPVTCLILPK